MKTSFDQLSPQPSRHDPDGAEHVPSDMDWCARFSRRIVALNPGLAAEEALDVAHELSFDDALRARSPERVAEALDRVAVQTED